MSFRSFIGTGPITPLTTIGNRDPLCTKKKRQPMQPISARCGNGGPTNLGSLEFPLRIVKLSKHMELLIPGCQFSFGLQASNPNHKNRPQFLAIKTSVSGTQSLRPKIPKKCACLLWDRTLWLHVFYMIAYKYWKHNHIVSISLKYIYTYTHTRLWLSYVCSYYQIIRVW